jgi:hypothetical protein
MKFFLPPVRAPFAAAFILLFAVSVRAETRLSVRTSTPLRTRADASADEVGRAQPGDILFAQEALSGWYAVSAPESASVWISEDLVEGNRVAARQGQVRSGPGIRHDLVGTLPRGTRVMSTGSENGWCRLSAPSILLLYVSADAVEEIHASAAPIHEVEEPAPPPPPPEKPARKTETASAKKPAPPPPKPAPKPAPVITETPHISPSTPGAPAKTAHVPTFEPVAPPPLPGHPARTIVPETASPAAVPPPPSGTIAPSTPSRTASPAPQPQQPLRPQPQVHAATHQPQPQPQPQIHAPAPVASQSQSHPQARPQTPQQAVRPVQPRPAVQPQPAIPASSAAPVASAPQAAAPRKIAPTKPLFHQNWVDELDIEPSPDQGKAVRIEGDLRNAPLCGYAPYRLIRRDARAAGAETLCHIKGDSAELRGFVGRTVVVRGYRYWVRGNEIPVIVLGDITVSGSDKSQSQSTLAW